MELMACQNLAVSAEVMQHIVHVESGSNPYAIGVVGGQLMRQPQNLGEAVATVQMLDAKGYNYSLGVAQVNRTNLGRYGLDSYEKAFEVCPNLAAGARILAACYASSGGDWGKAFSCYYSGNFVTGYRDGYVQKVYDSINRSANVADGNRAEAIPLLATPNEPRSGSKVNMTIMPADSSAYRVALRSVVLDTALAATVPVAAALVHGANDTAQTATQPQAASAPAATTIPAPIATIPKPTATEAASATTTAAAADIFVPQVRGPNDPPSTSAPAAPTESAQIAATSGPSQPAADKADLRQESRDAAFVF
ncbi:lytic transglycosylase domain-containing protein [Rhodanobacter sp. C01]|uniref:transglycosylase SLT domain-containing protein n=1 Tax=Rhodanobacter sp. C01 TaxID=1945856 RepID=UPI00157C7ADB